MSRRQIVTVWSAATLTAAALFAAQRVSAQHYDLTWERAGEWRHDLSLFALLIVAGLLAGSKWLGSAEPEAPRDHADGVREALGAAGRAGAAVFTLVLLALPAASYAIAERGGVPLIIAALLAVAAIAIRPAAVPLTVAAITITVAATWGVRANDGVVQQNDALLRAPTYPLELYSDGMDLSDSGIDFAASALSPPDGPPLNLRRGEAPVILDLRHLRIKDGRTLHLAARSDLDRVVVALPTDRCWAVRARVHRLDRRPPMLIQVAGASLGLNVGSDTDPGVDGNVFGVFVGERPQALHLTRPAPVNSTLLTAFGEYRTGHDLHWTRAVDDPAHAAILDLDVAVGTRLLVRDYPDNLPLSSVARPPAFQEDQNASNRLLSWPEVSITEAVRGLGGSVLVPNSAAAGRALAKQLAGVCATDRDLARRWVRFDVREDPSANVVAGESVTFVNGVGSQVTVPVVA